MERAEEEQAAQNHSCPSPRQADRKRALLFRPLQAAQASIGNVSTTASGTITSAAVTGTIHDPCRLIIRLSHATRCRRLTCTCRTVSSRKPDATPVTSGCE